MEGREGICPQNLGKYLSGKYRVTVKFGHFVNFSYIYGKNVLPPKVEWAPGLCLVIYGRQIIESYENRVSWASELNKLHAIKGRAEWKQ